MMVGHTVSARTSSRPEPDEPAEPRSWSRALPCYDEDGVKRAGRRVSFTAQRGRDARHRGHRRQRPAASCWSPSRACTPSTEGAIIVHTTADDGEAEGARRQDPDGDPRDAALRLSFVPEDRLGMGLVGSMGMTGNMMLRSWRKGQRSFFNRKEPEAAGRTHLRRARTSSRPASNYARAPPVRRQRAEGARRTRDRPVAPPC